MGAGHWVLGIKFPALDFKFQVQGLSYQSIEAVYHVSVVLCVFSEFPLGINKNE